MASIKTVQEQIYDCEGFMVELYDREGRGRPRLADYDFQRAARAAFTVAEWQAKRFDVVYPGFDVAVLRADGSRAGGRMALSRVRGEYEG